MAATHPTVFEPQHIDRLPNPLAQALIAAVFVFHGILIVLALQSLPLVELGGNGGGGSGNSALYVSVLSGAPAVKASHSRQSPPSGEKTVAVKEKPQSGLITTTSATSRSAQTVRPVENSTALPAEKPLAKQQSAASSNEAASSFPKSGSGNRTAQGVGQGAGDGKTPGTGHGEGSGNSMGAGGSGSGPARSVSLSQLKYKRAVKPEYPARSIQRRESGQVNIQVVVDAAGRVHDARITGSSGFDRLDEAALKAARHSTFHPYMEHGRPVYAMAIIPYRFNLNKP